jgi:hypothetical protein
MGKVTIWHVIGGLVATLFCFFFIAAGYIKNEDAYEERKKKRKGLKHE